MAQSLKALHDAGYAHQNLKWLNVLYDLDEKDFCLIDFEHATEYYGFSEDARQLAQMAGALSAHVHIPDQLRQLLPNLNTYPSYNFAMFLSHLDTIQTQ